MIAWPRSKVHLTWPGGCTRSCTWIRHATKARFGNCLMPSQRCARLPGGAMFVAKTLEDPLRRVVLLTVNRSVLPQNTVDDIREGGQLRAFRWLGRRYPGGDRPNAASTCVVPSSSRAMPTRLADHSPAQLYEHQHGRPAEHAVWWPTSRHPPAFHPQSWPEGYRCADVLSPLTAAGKSRRFRGLIGRPPIRQARHAVEPRVRPSSPGPHGAPWPTPLKRS